MKKARIYTRGPWKVTKDGAGCRMIGGAKPNDQRQAQYREIAYTVGLARDDEDAGNAALIAAAPRLLNFTRLLASYGCAGEPACDGDEKCGVCEAEAFLKATGLDTAAQH